MESYPEWLEIVLGNEIEQPISNDDRTTPSAYLGIPKDEIYARIIGGGQADFDKNEVEISADDRALLYAKYNQRRHIDELRYAFKKLFPDTIQSRIITLLDIGCGPFTAGLSWAAAKGSIDEFRYYGVDRAKSMLRLGGRLAKSAQIVGAYHPKSTYWFGTSLEEIDFGPIRGDWIVVVLSYLFASPNLDVEELMKSLDAALKRIGPGPVAVLYTNSARADANKKYPQLEAGLIDLGFDLKIEDQQVFTQTTKTKIPIRYALFIRNESTSLI